MNFAYSSFAEWQKDNPNGTYQEYKDAKNESEQGEKQIVSGIGGAISGTANSIGDKTDTGGNDTGKIVKNISPMLSAIPVVGGALSGVGTMIGGLLEKDAADLQAKQAERIRKEALNTKAQAIQSEYLKSLRMKEMAALSGLPALEEYKSALGAQTANTARAIRESSPNGAATLAAMSAAKGLENNSLQDLMGKNAEYKAGALTDLASALQGVGGEKQSLQDKADIVKRQGLQAASAFDIASTANKMGGINKILGALGTTASSLTKNADGTTNNDALIKKMLADYLAKNGGVSQENQMSMNPFQNQSNFQADNPLYSSQLGASTTDFSIPKF